MNRMGQFDHVDYKGGLISEGIFNLYPVHPIFEMFKLASNIKVNIELFGISMGQIQLKLIYIFVTYELASL